MEGKKEGKNRGQLSFLKQTFLDRINPLNKRNPVGYQIQYPAFDEDPASWITSIRPSTKAGNQVDWTTGKFDLR